MDKIINQWFTCHFKNFFLCWIFAENFRKFVTIYFFKLFPTFNFSNFDEFILSILSSFCETENNSLIPFIVLILQKVLIASIFEDFCFFFGVKYWTISFLLFEFISVEAIEIPGCFKEFWSMEDIIFLSFFHQWKDFSQLKNLLLIGFYLSFWKV